MLIRRLSALLIALLLGAGSLYYVQRVLIPYQKQDAVAHSRTRGILSDLYPRWIGARELILNHRDPYGPEVTREIQTGYYGRPLDPSSPLDPHDQQGFAHPVYVAFLLLPTLGLPFTTAQTIATIVFFLLTVVSIALWVALLHLSAGRSGALLIAILTLTSLPVIQGLKLQQLSLLVAALLAVTAALLAGGRFFAAGVLLALATIKPQLALLPTLWLLLWSFSRWRERQRVVWGFTSALAVLLACSEAVAPGWIPRFASAVAAYRQYAGGHSILDTLLPHPLALILCLAAMAAAATVCARTRTALANSPKFAHSLALVLAVTVLIVPMIAYYNQILLLPAVLLLWSRRHELWRRGLPTQAAYVITAALLFWPFISATSLSLISLAASPVTAQGLWAVPFYTSLYFPVALIGLLLLLPLHPLLPRPAPRIQLSPSRQRGILSSFLEQERQ